MSAGWVPQNGMRVSVWNDRDSLTMMGIDPDAAGAEGALTVMGGSGIVKTDDGKSFVVPLTMLRPTAVLDEDSDATTADDIATIDVHLFDPRAAKAYAERVKRAQERGLAPSRTANIVPPFDYWAE